MTIVFRYAWSAHHGTQGTATAPADWLGLHP